MTDPTHPLVGSRVRLTAKTSYPDLEGEVAVLGVPFGHTEEWALVLVENHRGRQGAFAYPLGAGCLEQLEEVDHVEA